MRPAQCAVKHVDRITRSAPSGSYVQCITGDNCTTREYKQKPIDYFCYCSFWEQFSKFGRVVLLLICFFLSILFLRVLWFHMINIIQSYGLVFQSDERSMLIRRKQVILVCLGLCKHLCPRAMSPISSDVYAGSVPFWHWLLWWPTQKPTNWLQHLTWLRSCCLASGWR